eukprot:scaffold99_cov160-Ochromonas_danica.AAC.13
MSLTTQATCITLHEIMLRGKVKAGQDEDEQREIERETLFYIYMTTMRQDYSLLKLTTLGWQNCTIELVKYEIKVPNRCRTALTA